MDALLYFLLWAGLVYFMMRSGCGAHVTGGHHGTGKGSREGGRDDTAAPRWTPPETDRDPVCGKTVRPDNAKPSVHDGMVYYFCSRECREVFEAAPGQYVAPPARSGPPRRGHDHG